MTSTRYSWDAADGSRTLELVHVHGTGGRRYHFGERGAQRPVDVSDFLITTTPVTQAFWDHIMGAESNPSIHRGPELPLENVSWDDLTRADGFLDCLNASRVLAAIAESAGGVGRFRLPSETEWEYAARGGPRWEDGFRFSGSDDIERVAWYDRRHGDHTQPVGQKAPNQLGLHDMSGNIWEWCQDTYASDAARTPQDGTPFADEGNDRVLRGGCFHNWAEHCTVSKRYSIARDYRDGCIGCRLVLALPRGGKPAGELTRGRSS